MEGKPPVMNRVFIFDQAMVTALAGSVDENWQRLLAGETAIREIRHFSTQRLDYHLAACIDDLWSTSLGSRICELQRRSLQQMPPLPDDAKVVWTGIKGDVEVVESSFRSADFYRPVHYRRWVEDQLGLKDGGFEINAACASSTVGIALASQKIQSGQWNSALICAADLVSRFTHTGFSALKALTPTVCRPFDARRDGLVLGEASFAMLIGNDQAAQNLGKPPLAEICGWGIANDANHITGPSRDGFGLMQSIQQALKIAGMDAAEIEAFCAHGTGTVYNDAMELTAVEQVFGERRFPVFSIKGALGHTLGAAGGIETILSRRCLQEKTTPPTCGFEQGEERTAGRLCAKSQRFGGNNILTTNSGFGGVNAALVLKRIDQ
jgi:3-oxoacyl-[acyl-carrier-protein] synthase II